MSKPILRFGRHIFVCYMRHIDIASTYARMISNYNALMESFCNIDIIADITTFNNLLHALLTRPNHEFHSFII